ncbi:hypothetical protein QR680_007261 [Steinernema hermaphroditum]|uniref:Uncharacterized protein n=1 Tax=Steinernema hermaphroditum TaxID=289476 RepID=A0AA39HZS9_9BILA|nr:hypothetical protein QR680_007261 [Steinernema hermaphroditum]
MSLFFAPKTKFILTLHSTAQVHQNINMQQTAIYLLLVLALVGYAEDPASLMGEACENTMRVIGQLFAPVPDIEDIIRRSVSAMPAVLTASAGCKIFKLCTYNNCGVNGYCGPLLPNLPKVMVCKCHPTTDNKPKEQILSTRRIPFCSAALLS